MFVSNSAGRALVEFGNEMRRGEIDSDLHAKLSKAPLENHRSHYLATFNAARQKEICAREQTEIKPQDSCRRFFLER